MPLEQLMPERVFKFFREICSIPHGSGNMEAISAYCEAFAKKHSLEYTKDELLNVVIKKPASAGYEAHPSVILQGHLDMVCEKAAGIDFDFKTEPLKLQLEGDWLSASGTTLGGDDGIAVAMILAILEADLPHPAIEAVFTTDEETGMYGAEALDCSQLSSKRLINIDSENEGILTVSCAGGAHADLSLKLEKGKTAHDCYKITVNGLIGGHSGVEIHKGRLNANKVMAQFLKSLAVPFNLISYNGGNKDNAITRECVCVISADFDVFSAAQKFVAANKNEADPQLNITVERVESADGFSENSSKAAINLICALPYGVMAMSEEIAGLVETSLNLGIVYIEDAVLHCRFSLRSSKGEGKQQLIKKLGDIISSYGGSIRLSGDYPAWEFRKDSPLRSIMASTWKELYSEEIKIEAIHAGLECGLFYEKIKGLDAVSIGPDLQNIHTPAEKLSIASVKKVYEYLCEVLKNL